MDKIFSMTSGELDEVLSAAINAGASPVRVSFVRADEKFPIDSEDILVSCKRPMDFLKFPEDSMKFLENPPFTDGFHAFWWKTGRNTDYISAMAEAGKAEAELVVVFDPHEMGFQQIKRFAHLTEIAAQDSGLGCYDKECANRNMKLIDKANSELSLYADDMDVQKGLFENAQSFECRGEIAARVPLYAAVKIMGILEDDRKRMGPARELAEIVAYHANENWDEGGSSWQWDEDRHLALREDIYELFESLPDRKAMELAAATSWVIEGYVTGGFDGSSDESQYSCGGMNIDPYGYRRGIIDTRNSYINNESAAGEDGEDDDSDEGGWASDEAIMGCSLHDDDIDFPCCQTFRIRTRSSDFYLSEKANINIDDIIDKVVRDHPEKENKKAPKAAHGDRP